MDAASNIKKENVSGLKSEKYFIIIRNVQNDLGSWNSVTGENNWLLLVFFVFFTLVGLVAITFVVSIFYLPFAFEVHYFK